MIDDNRKPLKIGTRINFEKNDDYEIIKILGIGATSIVYKIKNVADKSVYAIKEFFPLEADCYRDNKGEIIFKGENCEIISQKYNRFEIENQFGNSFEGDVPSIVQSHYMKYAYINGEKVSNHYLIMSNLNGITLEEYMENYSCSGSLPNIKEIVYIIKSFAKQIEKIHNSGYILCDIKSENLYMFGYEESSENWFPFLIDYGSVIEIDRDSEHGYSKPVIGGVFATKGYASWEMVHGYFEEDDGLFRLTPSSDIYALGRLFLYLLSGETYVDELKDTDLFVDNNNDKNDIFMEELLKNRLGDMLEEVGCSEYALKNVENILKNILSNDWKKRYQKIEDLIISLSELEKKLNVEFYLRSSFPDQNVDDYYIERNEYYELLDEGYKHNNIIVLNGKKGIGKTELAIRYAKRFQSKNRDNIVIYTTFQNITSNGNIENVSKVSSVLSTIPLFNETDGINNSGILKYIDNYSNRFNILRSLCNKNVLLLIDNFDILDNKSIEELSKLGCKVLLITNVDYAAYHVLQIKLNQLNLIDGIKLYKNYCPEISKSEETVVEEIINHVAGLTQAIIIIASKQHKFRYTAKKMLEDLSDLSYHNMQTDIKYYKNGNINEESDIGIMNYLFDTSGLSTKQQEILFKLSLLGNAGAELKSFKNWAECSDYSDIDELLSLNWIRENQYKDIYLVSGVRSVVSRNNLAYKWVSDFIKAFCEIKGEKTIEIYKELIHSISFYLNRYSEEEKTFDGIEFKSLIEILNMFFDKCRPIIDAATKQMLLIMAEKLDVLISKYIGKNCEQSEYNKFVNNVILYKMLDNDIYANNEFYRYLLSKDGLCDYYVYKYYDMIKECKIEKPNDISLGKLIYYLRNESYYKWSLCINGESDGYVLSQLKKEASDGNNYSKCILGEYYLDISEDGYDDTGFNYLVDIISSKSKTALKIAARRIGDVLLYYSKDEERAVKFYNMAKENGDVEALIRLGYLYERNGNVENALKYYIEAEKNGSLMAKNNIAICYMNNPSKKDKAFEYLKEISQYGHALGMSNLGLVYAYQEDHKDIIKAYKWEKMAADTGLIEALERMALMYEEGVFGEPDPEKCFEYRVKALQAKSLSLDIDPLENLKFIADAYLNGEGVGKNEELALYYYNEGVKYKQIGCYRGLIKYYMGKDDFKAFQLLEEMAPMGDSFDKIYLAQYYQYGVGTKVDSSRAIYWYNEALKQGDYRAYSQLGKMYELGEGVETDYEKAFQYYKKAAEAEDGEGMFLLAEMYAKGLWHKTDYNLAFKWYSKSAESGYNDANERLGRAYLDGIGTNIDFKKSLELFEKCDDITDDELLYRIGDVYQYNINNQFKALEWYEKSAEHKNINGMLKTAYIYDKADGIHNKNKAKMWVDLAEKNYIANDNYTIRNKIKIKKIRSDLGLN